MDIHAPFAGTVRYLVAVGETVTAGQRLATVEAVKLEAGVDAPGAGVVEKLDHSDFSDVGGGERLLVLGEK